MRQVSSFVRLGILAVVSMVLGVTACTKDSTTTQEAVDASKTEIPAEPGDADGSYRPENVYFAFDQSTLTEAGFSNLDQLGAHLQKHADVKVEVQGHADERGGEEYNLALGARRAAAVQSYLVKLGVEEARLKTVSFGKLRPADERHSSEGWAKNRRAEFVLSR
jgi:peptidoglycan-associated lipoprotein